MTPDIVPGMCASMRYFQLVLPLTVAILRFFRWLSSLKDRVYGWLVFFTSNFLHRKHQMIVIRPEKFIDYCYLGETWERNISEMIPLMFHFHPVRRLLPPQILLLVLTTRIVSTFPSRLSLTISRVAAISRIFSSFDTLMVISSLVR